MKATIDILRELRQDRDLTQSQVAAYIGTTQQHYSKYENGIYELPFRYFAKLAELYDVSADYLLGRTKRVEGKSYQNVYVTQNCSCTKLLEDVLALGETGRQAVVDYIQLQQLREKSRS